MLSLPRMSALDTSEEAGAIQDEAHRNLGPVGRFNTAVALSNLAHRFAEAGIRRRHPNYSSEQVTEALATALYRVSKP